MTAQPYTPKTSDYPARRVYLKDVFGLTLALLLIVVLACISMLLGTADLSLKHLASAVFALDSDSADLQVLLLSRIPRTAALILAGTSLSIVGLIMQMLVRNRFVEPTTSGTAASSTLGILFVTLVFPQSSVFIKMLVATLFAVAGTFVFILILRKVPLRSILIVPLIGLVLAGIIDSVTTFFAYRFQLLQSLTAWTMGDFSNVIAGRYELLWLSFALSVFAYIYADRFTVAGMGKSFATSLGLNYQYTFVIGLVLVAMVTAMVVVTVGIIPFIGLIVPNLVAMVIGDNARRSIPWIGVTGAILMLLCDIFGRVVNYPYEIPASTIIGVLGCVTFLYLLLKRNHNFG